MIKWLTALSPNQVGTRPDSAVYHGALFPIWRKTGLIRERDFAVSLVSSLGETLQPHPPSLFLAFLVSTLSILRRAELSVTLSRILGCLTDYIVPA